MWLVTDDCVCVCVAENNRQMKVFLPNKLLECLPRTNTLPKERLRWNTNEVGVCVLHIAAFSTSWITLIIDVEVDS